MTDTSMTLIESEPINIIKSIRLDNNYGLQDFANYAGVSQQVILRSEQGIYPTLPPSVSHAILQLKNLTSNELEIKYEEFRKQHRLWAQETKPLTIKALREPTILVHPLMKWRTLCGYDSRMSFCVAFCLHSSTVTRFEMGESRHIPLAIQELLFDIYPESTAKAAYGMLVEKYASWSYKGAA